MTTTLAGFAMARILFGILLLCSLGCDGRSVPASVQQLPPPSSARGSVVALALARRDLDWARQDTHHLRLYAVRGGRAARSLPALGLRAEAARSDVLALLGATDYSPRVTLLLVPTREVMRTLVGWPAGGWGLAEENAAIYVVSDTVQPALRHELAHVLSWNLWGVPAGGVERGQWISEGLATLAGGGCHGVSLHTLAGAYRASGDFQSLSGLDSSFNVRTIRDYVEAGSFLEFVRDTYGRPAVRLLWQQGVGALSESVGLTVADLGRLWERGIVTAPRLPDSQDLATVADVIHREGCERET